jgi:hypothetical protein
VPPEDDKSFFHAAVLVSPDHTVWAVNCRRQDDALHCGALHVGPSVPFDIIRLADSTAMIDVQLPTELQNLPHAVRLWEVLLPLANV